MLNPVIIGEWDGTHVWLQWEPVPAPETGAPTPGAIYEMRCSFRPVGSDTWQDWRSIVRPPRAWMTYLVSAQFGTGVRAQVRLGTGASTPEEGWETAEEATFVRSVCQFSISSTKKAVHFIEDVKFHTRVDGAVCSYRLKEEVEVEPGEFKIVEMEALASSCWAQIDKPGDFIMRPSLGLTIQNIEPSRNDVKLTGRDFTELKVMKRDGPFSMVVTPPTDH